MIMSMYGMYCYEYMTTVKINQLISFTTNRIQSGKNGLSYFELYQNSEVPLKVN